MVASYLTFETSQNLPMNEVSVTETTDATYSGTFPSAFQTSGSNIMVVCDITADGAKRQIMQELERIMKAVDQSVNFKS